MPTSDSSKLPVRLTAAQWAARLDRGLIPAEQDAYLQWLRDDPAHGEAMAQLAETWKRLGSLTQWRPLHARQPNPDLLAPPRSRIRFGITAVALAFGVAVLAVGLWWRPDTHPSAEAIDQGPDRLTLADGSQVELNRGASIDVQYTSDQRVVRLSRGEAHFTIAKDPARPFLVVADDLMVRATGTAFAASVFRDGVSVLVTEGRVRIEPSEPATGFSEPPSEIGAGEEGVARISRGALRIELKRRKLSPAELDRALAWRTTRLEFNNVPLREVVMELNRFSARKLVVADAQTGDLPIGGSFRTNNAEAFARLLVAGFDLESEDRGEYIVLRRARP